MADSGMTRANRTHSRDIAPSWWPRILRAQGRFLAGILAPAGPIPSTRRVDLAPAAAPCYFSTYTILYIDGRGRAGRQEEAVVGRRVADHRVHPPGGRPGDAPRE